MGNKEIFLYVVDYIKNTNGFISVDNVIKSEFGENDTLAKDFIEKLLKYNLAESSAKSNWHVRKKQRLLEISKKDLIKVFKGQSLEKPKWQTLDFYMDEVVKYVIGAIAGSILTYIAYRLSH